jgi:hypothetical protein
MNMICTVLYCVAADIRVAVALVCVSNSSIFGPQRSRKEPQGAARSRQSDDISGRILREIRLGCQAVPNCAELCQDSCAWVCNAQIPLNRAH